jgi:hypothetical protein
LGGGLVALVFIGKLVTPEIEQELRQVKTGLWHLTNPSQGGMGGLCAGVDRQGIGIHPSRRREAMDRLVWLSKTQ